MRRVSESPEAARLARMLVEAKSEHVRRLIANGPHRAEAWISELTQHEQALRQELRSVSEALNRIAQFRGRQRSGSGDGIAKSSNAA